MKKFFLTIFLLLMAMGGLSAQALNLNNFSAIGTNGQCSSDGKIKVSLPAGMGPTGTKLQVKLDIPNDPAGRTWPLEIGVTGKDSCEFTTLKAGTYTLTMIEVATNKKSTSPKLVTITSTYVPPLFVNGTLKANSPTCTGDGNDGSIDFTIQPGAKGPFIVKLTKGTTLIYTGNHTKTTASQSLPITIQGSATTPISVGSDYELSVEDLAGGVANCGDTNKTNITILSPSLTLSCLDLELNFYNSGIRMDGNCKIGFSFQLLRKDKVTLSPFQNDIKTSNAVFVKRYNSAGNLIASYPIASNFDIAWRGAQVAASSSFTTPYVFQENDIVEIEVNLGKTPIKRKFKLDENIINVIKNLASDPVNTGQYIFRDTSGSRVIEAQNRSDLNVNPAKPCNDPTQRYLYVDNYWRSVRLPDLDNPSQNVVFGTYYWHNGLVGKWHANAAFTGEGYYYEIYRFIGTGFPGWNNAYTTNQMDETNLSKWVNESANVVWLNENYADLSGLPDGYYMVKFKAKNAAGNTFCYEPKRVVEIKAKTNQIGRQFQGIEIGKGVFKGTISMYKWLMSDYFNYPVTVSIDYLDDPGAGTGNRTYDFLTSMPFETSQRTVTYTFPIIRTLLNPQSASSNAGLFQFGDLPAGNYRITFTDKCGNTTFRDFNFDTPMQYDKDEVKVEQGCAGSSKITYDIGATPIGTINYATYTLYKKGPSGNYDTFVESSRNRNHTFNNLLEGDYMFEAKGFYYISMKEAVWKDSAQSGDTGVMNWKSLADSNRVINGFSMINSPDIITPSDPQANGTTALHKSRVYLTVKPTRELQRDVVGTSCSASSGSGIVAVGIKNPDNIRYPLTFTLKNKATGTLKETKTFGATSTDTSYVFKNVDNGTYILTTSHACGIYTDEVLVNTDNYTAPTISYIARSTNPCNGDVVDLTFGGSTQLFDIEWFRIENDTTETSLGFSQTISDTVTRDTKYLVRYKLQDPNLCVNRTGETSVTIQFSKDTTPPVITGCPTDTITVEAISGRCYGVATWGVVTATDDCRIGTWSQSHQSGQRFNIGTNTVTYVFSDTSGNTATCTFNVVVTSRAIKMDVKSDYVDASESPINRDLGLSETFYYRIRYKNQGTANVTTATMQITLPNHPNITVGTPDLSKAKQNIYRPTVLASTPNTITIDIPKQTITPGANERTILIPLTLNGDCSEVGKPCMNLLSSTYSFTYIGGLTGCTIPEQTTAGTKTITISTQNCMRNELACDNGAGINTFRIQATPGFLEYKWYKNNLLQPNPRNENFFDADEAATYKVEKINVCGGVTYTTTEIIQVQTPQTLSDPIKPQSNGGDICADNNIWVSHFILCNQPSRNIVVNFKDTNFVWQKLKTGSNPTSLNCPNVNDSVWDDVHSNRTFVANTQGHFRLKVSNSEGCNTNFYFDVFTNSLNGRILDYGDVTNYQQGYVLVQMATAGITYKYILKDAFGNVVNQNGQPFVNTTLLEYRVPITAPGTYTIEVTSPALPDSCKLVLTQEIKKITTLSAKAIAKAWKGCNLRSMRFEATGGKNPYQFAVWSIDGVIQNGYSDYNSVPASAFFATIPVGASFVESDVHIDQPGKYIFIAKDDVGGYALTPEVDIYPENFLGYTIKTRDILCGFADNTGQISITYNTIQNVKTILYKFDNTGGKTYIDENGTGFFNNLTAGRYEIEIKITMGSLAGATCTYRNPNVVINNIESTLSAYAGVIEDISCDTATPPQYKVRVNNVTGGTGTGYEYSSNNVTYSSNPILMVGSTASVVYVRDSNKCTLEIPISIRPIVPPTVTATTVTYDCEGRGTFTVTTNPTGKYEFRLMKSDGTISETRTSNVFTLSPGVYSIEAIYTPASATGTTPNILFKEDFGKGEDTCNSQSVFITCAAGTTTLGDNQYMITRQVPTAGTNWVTTPPADASGVTDGRYLAINGTSPDNDNGVIYRRTIKDIVPNTELKVSMHLFNLLPPTFVGGANPNLLVRLYNPANPAAGIQKSLGELQRLASWELKDITFADTDITFNTAVFEIRNTAAASTIGSDLAVDNITISQPTKLCAVRAESLSIKVDNDKAFKVRGTAYDEKCGNNDGSIYLVVDNPSGSSVQYHTATATAWTTLPLTAIAPTQGVATITGLSAVNNGTLFVRRTSDTSCETSIDYTIKKPVPLTVTATVTAPVTCLNTFASVRFIGNGGAKPYRNFSFSPITGSTPAATQSSTNNEADINLTQGTYIIQVEDANGCTATATLNVPDVKPLQVEIVDLEPCFTGGNIGRLQIKVTNGNGEYKFSKDGGATFENGSVAAGTSHIFENLTAGTYNFVIKDGADCQTNTSYTIENPLRIQVTSINALTCMPNSEAEYKITYTGGRTGVREFLWSHTPTTGFTAAVGTGMTMSQAGNVYTFKTKVEGDYYFRVRYQMPNGDYCNVTSVKQEVKVVLPVFAVTPTVENVNCAGANTGKIRINTTNVTGGVPPYTLLLNDGLSVQSHPIADITGLQPGTYTITIEDSANCKSVPVGFTVTQVTAMVVTATNTPMKCSATGTQLATAEAAVTSGGTAPYRFTLVKNGATIQTRNNITQNSIVQYNNLDIGNYQIVIEDANTCKYIHNFVINSEANGLDVRPTGVVGCAGITGEVAISVYDKNGGTIQDGQYIAVYHEGMQIPYGTTSSQRTMPDGYTWYRGGAVVTTTLSDGSVVQASTHTFTGLAPGVIYTFIVFDSNTNCTFTKEANIHVPTQSNLQITINGTASTTCADANDGKVFVNLKNWSTGTTNLSYRVYRYIPSLIPGLLDPIIGPVPGTVPVSGTEVDATITNVPAGRYFILFTDGNGCTMGSKEFTIGKSTSLLTATATVAKLANCNQPIPSGLGKITVEAAGGTAPYQYYYHNLATPAPMGTALDAALASSLDGVSKNVISGTWEVYVKDALGCLTNTTIVVGMDPQPSIATVTVLDACSDNADYPINVVFNTIGVGQNQYKIDGISNWQNINVATQTILPIRLAPNAAPYTISFRDANGCETSTTFRVNEMIKYNADHTPMYCGGSATTTINVTNITGGSGTYKIGLYRITDKGTPNERAVTVVAPGTTVTGTSYSVPIGYGIGAYRIHIYDTATFGTAAECAKITDFNVLAPETPQLEVLSVSTPTCANETAIIRVKATPVGIAPYTFNIVDKNTGLTPAGVTSITNVNYITFMGVPSGPRAINGFDYYISAQSVYSCTTTITVNVTSPDVVTVTAGSLSKEDYQCTLDDDGYLTGESSNPKLHFDISGVSGGTGKYTRVEFKTASGTLANQQQIEDGVTKYTYTLPTYLTSPTGYYAEVYDTNGCSVSTTIETISPTLIMSGLTVNKTQTKTCLQNEVISVTLNTITPYNNEPIEYSLVKIGIGVVGTPVTLNSLTWATTIADPANYIITAKNLNTNCEVTTNYTVLEPNTLLLEAKDPQRITCKGGTGQITLELTDTRLSDGDQVANGFNYVITPLPIGTPITGSSLSGTKVHPGLPAGHYKVEATSPITGCTAVATFELVEAAESITVFAEETRSVTCDNNRGEILVTVSGGWAPYTVNIQGGAITKQKTIALDGDSALFDRLSATGTPRGSLTYNITITDAWGCNIVSGITSVTLLDPDPVAAVVTVTQHATCAGSTDGIITVSGTTTGGSGSYYYTLLNEGTGKVKGPQRNEPKFDNLDPGFYTYEIMDTWGCSLVEQQIEIIEPKPIKVSIVSATSELQVCYGGNDASIDFTVEGGRPPYNIKVLNKYTNSPHLSLSNVIPGTTPFRDTGLNAGEWKIEVTDSSPNGGCTMSPTFEFSIDSAPDLKVDLEVINSCKNNNPYTQLEVRFKDKVDVNKVTYRLNGIGSPKNFVERGNGVNVWYISPPDLDTNVQTQTIELIYTSIHSLTQTSRTCSITLANAFEVEKIKKLKITRTPTTVVNTIQVEGLDGVKPYHYVFNGEDYDTNNVYELKITDPDYIDPISGKTKKKIEVQVFDASGCTASDTIYEEYFDVKIPNFFTPNGDGVYDTWSPMYVEKYPFIRSTIFDRFGRRIKVLRAGEAWDGKYEGKDMPTGDYWYIVELTDEFDTRIFNGNFTLYR